MTKKQHIKRHKELHKYLDELVADFIFIECRGLSDSSVMELVKWSYEQTLNPRTEPLLRRIS